MNKKKGITLLALLATIIIMVILLGVVVFSYDKIVKDIRIKEFAKEIFGVRNQVMEYEFKHGDYPFLGTITVDITTIPAKERFQFSRESSYGTNAITLNVIDLGLAGVSEVKRGASKYGQNDIYAFSIETKMIYYIKGEEMATGKYYTLTKELYTLLGVQDELYQTLPSDTESQGNG